MKFLRLARFTFAAANAPGVRFLQGGEVCQNEVGHRNADRDPRPRRPNRPSGGHGSTTAPIVLGTLTVEMIDQLTGFTLREVVGCASTTDGPFDETLQFPTVKLLPLGKGLKILNLLIRRGVATTGFRTRVTVPRGCGGVAGMIGLVTV